jgi:hypothetical protein
MFSHPSASKVPGADSVRTITASIAVRIAPRPGDPGSRSTSASCAGACSTPHR